MTTLLASQGWDAINQSDDEWITPGYSVATLHQIDPVDYAGSNMSETRDVLSLQCYSVFVDTPDGDKWRVILLFGDKLVLLQEDSEVREFSIPDPGARDMRISPNGRWCIVTYRPHNLDDGVNWIERESRRELFDLDTGDRYNLDQIRLTQDFALVSDNGELLVIRQECWEFNFIQGIAFYNPISGNIKEIEYFFGNGQYYSRSADGSLTIVTESADQGYLRAYDSRWHQVWRIPAQGHSEPIITPDGELVYLVWGTGLTVLDGDTGRTISKLFGGRNIRLPVLSSGGMYLAFEMFEYPDSTCQASNWFIVAPVSSWLDDHRVIQLDLDPEIWAVPFPEGISDTGNVLFRVYSPWRSTFRKWGLLDNTGNLIWFSETFMTPGDPDPETGYDERSFAWFNKDNPHAISSDGSRIIYGTMDHIVIAEIIPNSD
jgi:hypothetical protein